MKFFLFNLFYSYNNNDYYYYLKVPLPLPGTCLHVSYGECNLIVKRPSNNELPFFDYPIQILFNYITIERFIKLFTCFMLEHQILICSKCKKFVFNYFLNYL